MTTQSAPAVVLDPGVHAPGDGVWFALPPGFTTLPLGALLPAPGSPEAQALQETVAPLLASAPDEVTRQAFGAKLATTLRMLHSLRGEGVVHCSLGLHRDDTGGGDSGPLLSFFTIAWVDTSWAPRGVTAARAVTEAEGHTHLEYAELPCGPATFSRIVRTPTPESGLPRQPLLQLHAHLPHPDGTSLALLTLSTTATERYEEYQAILRQIAELVGFDEPFATDGEERSR
ncbi:hypothetical protein [Streptomyces sp. NPDC086766]|uniref:hypothetical protein n=1 Tax=Streptomyces sp. NPDC086766 TaxID=3365754 RepID=UPI00382760F5